MKLTSFAVAASMVTLGLTGQAAAVSQNRSDKQSAVNNCRVALPSFEGAFRKRPLGIANEGASIAFLSCGLPGNSAGSMQVVISFTNKGAANVDVPCTLVSGIGSAFEATAFFPKTFTLGPGATFRGWSKTAENSGVDFSQPSISCAIPPHVELNATAADYKVDVGL